LILVRLGRRKLLVNANGNESPHGLGEAHAGVQFATIGWILPLLHDPDGHEVRFYTLESHTAVDSTAPLIVEDAIASARMREREWRARQAASASAAGAAS
jgi:hypothetical protein